MIPSAARIFGDLKLLAPTVSVEAVIAADPEAVVASGMDEARPEWLDDWRQWRGMTAVKRDNLFFIPPDLIQRHTPRLVEGAARLCAHLETPGDGAVTQITSCQRPWSRR
jgi:iron complex transport system substrate-binding protein